MNCQLSVFLCICWHFIHFDFAGGQRAGQPLQVSQFERQQDEADAVSDVHRALRVQEVVRCPIPNVFLKSSSHRLVHPVGDRGEVRKMKRRKMGRVGRRVFPDVHTGLRSRGSRYGCRFLTVAACRSCPPLRNYGNGRGGAWSPQWAREWPGTSLTSLPVESGRYRTAEDPVERWNIY